MAKGKKANPWDTVFARIQVSRRPNYLYVSPATDGELAEVEAQLGSPLPAGYRAFLSRYGSGLLYDWAGVYGISSHRQYRRSLVALTLTQREFFATKVGPRPNQRWLASVVYFGDYQGNALFAWDPAAVATKRPLEYKIYELPRHEEESPVHIADSFAGFLQWIDAEIRRWRDPAEVAEMGPGIPFTPTYIRGKKAPLKRDVKLWLAFNNNAARDLARSIRGGHPDAFPVLADALEEAGCTNADLLDSCRRGDPDIDGAWVLRVLLGEE